MRDMIAARQPETILRKVLVYFWKAKSRHSASSFIHVHYHVEECWMVKQTMLSQIVIIT